MNILDWIYRTIMRNNLNTHNDKEYTRYANPNATQSEFDGKVIITPPDTYYQYLKRQQNGQDRHAGYGSTNVSRRSGEVEGIS